MREKSVTCWLQALNYWHLLAHSVPCVPFVSSLSISDGKLGNSEGWCEMWKWLQELTGGGRRTSWSVVRSNGQLVHHKQDLWENLDPVGKLQRATGFEGVNAIWSLQVEWTVWAEKVDLRDCETLCKELRSSRSGGSGICDASRSNRDSLRSIVHSLAHAQWPGWKGNLIWAL